MLAPRRPVRRGVVLALVCCAQFMLILDLAIVNVAIPSMQADLHLDQADLQWVVITYGLALGGFLLLGGRAADLFGRRRVLVTGLALFALASLGAGMSEALWQLVTARAIQGLGAALAAPAALSILTNTFPEGAERNKALGLFGAVGGTAGTVGVIAGGLFTEGPGWEWIFLVNVPIGAALVALVLAFLPGDRPSTRSSVDLAGAVTVTAALLAIVYAINKSVDAGWTSSTTLGFAALGAALLAAFVAVELRASAPLVPFGVFRRRTFTTANLVGALVWAAFFATIFEGTLFMQQGLGYSAVETGSAWLAATLSSLVVAGGIAPRFVGRFGAGTSLVVGQLLVTVGLLSLTRVPADASYWADLFPGFLAFGLGLGFSMMAVQSAAFVGIDPENAGFAGGMVETSREVGGAIGVAVVSTLALARVDDVLAELGGGAGARPFAITEGFQRATLVAAGLSLAAAVAAGVLLRRAERSATTGAPTTATTAPMAAATASPTAVALSSTPTVPAVPSAPTAPAARAVPVTSGTQAASRSTEPSIASSSAATTATSLADDVPATPAIADEAGR